MRACVWKQVGASNELPESEELDALYDRFLIRREVSQVRLRALLSLPAPLSCLPYPTLHHHVMRFTPSRVFTICGGCLTALQVSKEGVGELLMAAGAEGTMDSIPDSNDFFASSSYGSSYGSSPRREPTLSAEEMRSVKDRALKAVTVPQEVVDLLVDLRTHLQVCVLCVCCVCEREGALRSNKSVALVGRTKARCEMDACMV